MPLDGVETPGNGVIVRVRRPQTGIDINGDPIYGPTERLTLVGAFTAPRTTADINSGRQGVIIGLTLFAAHEYDIEHLDEIEVDGVLYAMDGDPGYWLHPWSSWPAGLEAALVRAEG